MILPKVCQHIEDINEIKLPLLPECAECMRTGSRWVHLRTCQNCGITLCCDDSPNKHMTAHYRQTEHPVIISAEPGERWMWCNVDKLFVEYT